MKKCLVLLLLGVFLTGCNTVTNSESASVSNNDIKENYVTVDIDIDNSEVVEETTEESSTKVIYKESDLKKVLKSTCYLSFDLYNNNGRDTLKKYTAEVDVSKKIYHIEDENNNIEYWNNYKDMIFYEVKDKKPDKVKKSLTSLNISESKIDSTFDLWKALCKDFALKNNSEGEIIDDYVYFTTSSDVDETEVKGLKYDKLLRKEVTHIFRVYNGKLDNPKSLTVTIYYELDGKEYTVSTSLNFKKFGITGIDAPKYLRKDFKKVDSK